MSTKNVFIAELASRLNTMLEQDLDHTNEVLASPCGGYAGVVYFLGVLSISPGEMCLKDDLFLFPIIQHGKIQKFSVVSGTWLQAQTPGASLN